MSSQETPTAAVYLYEGVCALDAIGPYESLWQIPGCTVRFVGEKKGPVRTDSAALALTADYDFSDVGDVDVLVVPGSSVSFLLEMRKEPVLEWLRSAHGHTRWTAGVCSGVLILGAAGLLKKVRATTNPFLRHTLGSFGAVADESELVVDQTARIVSAAAVSSGIELGLFLARELDSTEIAEAIQLMLGYDPTTWSLPFQSGSPKDASTRTDLLARYRLLVNGMESARRLDESLLQIARDYVALNFDCRCLGRL